MNNHLEEIKKIICESLGEPSNLLPIGNHELKRHMVFSFFVKEIKYVIKIFYTPNRWKREKDFYSLFKSTEIPIPTMIDSGVTSGEREWIITEHVNGNILEKVQDKIPLHQLRAIYKELGKILGTVHTYSGNFPTSIENRDRRDCYYKAFRRRLDIILEELYAQDHQEFELLKASERKLLNIICDVKKEKIPTSLCMHDFGARNTIVEAKEGIYRIKCIIDFEHVEEDDPHKDIYNYYLPKETSLERELDLAFRSGYESLVAVSEDVVLSKATMYNLYSGLYTCSWAKDNAYDYYCEKIQLLKKSIMCTK